MFKVLDPKGNLVQEFETELECHRYVSNASIPLEVVDSQGFSVTATGKPISAVALRVMEVMAREGCSYSQAYRLSRQEARTGQVQHMRPLGRPKKLHEPEFQARIDAFIAKGLSPSSAYQKARLEKVRAAKGIEIRHVGRPSLVEVAIRWLATKYGVTEAEAQAAYYDAYNSQDAFVKDRSEETRVVVARNVAAGRFKRAQEASAAPAPEVTQ